MLHLLVFDTEERYKLPKPKLLATAESTAYVADFNPVKGPFRFPSLVCLLMQYI